MSLEIIAIGGGEIGRPGCPIETFEIDSFTYTRSLGLCADEAKEKRNFLFVPTAFLLSRLRSMRVDRHPLFSKATSGARQAANR